MSIIKTMYRGESDFKFVPHRRRFYIASAIVIVISILSIAIRGFNYGVEFKGGSQFQITTSGTHITTSEVTNAFSAAGLPGENSAQEVGSGSTQSIIIVTKATDLTTQTNVIAAVAKSLGISNTKINPTTVSSDWGHQVTVQALEGLVIFLIVVSIYISIRYQWRMAVAGIIALIHDLIVAAGIYSIVGFQVTPSTVVGLLTILGFSLYDTVVVFDKVAENSKDILAGTKYTFSEAANKAVNQTLMRSINTSLIALLPVAGLLFVGAGILGVGTIKDLALVLFVGLASGAYSSLFLATPLVVELTEREAAYQALTRRVATKRASDAKRGIDLEAAAVAAAPVRRPSSGPAPAPKPGARPVRKR